MKEVKSINHLEDRMYRNPKTNRQVMTAIQVKETLVYTNNFLTACGDNYQLKVKNIGAGMKEVTLIPY